MPIAAAFRQRIAARLRLLYGDRGPDALRRIDELADRYGGLRRRPGGAPWGPETVFLITYGDQVRRQDQPALEVLGRFLLESGCGELFSGIHLLPCFPYSSDDGFAVIDYRRIDPLLGDWEDVRRIRRSFTLMLDLVVNHCSRRNEWFEAYLRGREPYAKYFIEVDPDADLSAVVRPRTSPLVTPFETSRGTRHVWTTFSPDQIDLNFADPDVLLQMLDVLLFYVEQGARWIRLDAIGFLWKRVGTPCMHLPETHAVVKLMRNVLDDLAPGAVLLTETNVPHEENVSYFGAGDEARAVYNFSLAPLLLDALLSGDAGTIRDWLGGLAYPGPGMTFFNFTASHDGIGVRPLEGLVSERRLGEIVDAVRRRGGRASSRRRADGSEAVYELNVSYLSALDEPGGLPPARHAAKFLASQAVMLALGGVPGVYFHSLVGTPNHEQGVRRSGHHRAINRRKYELDELRAILADEGSVQRLVFDGYRRLLTVRRRQPAFHPDAAQKVIETGGRSVLAFERASADGGQRIVVLANLGREPVRVQLPAAKVEAGQDLLSGRAVEAGRYEMGPYGVAWLAEKIAP